MEIEFDRRFEPRHGEPVPVGPGILRVTAPNAGPFTFHGTNSYLVPAGGRSLVLVDPGPGDDRHFDALVAAIGGRAVEAILLTHSHIDHTGLARRMRAAFDAPILAEGRHRLSRPLHPGETDLMEAANDAGLVPDRLVADGERLAFGAVSLEAVATPGHTANHMAFLVEGTGHLLSGDHVMAWSTTIVAPPEGSMTHYMASLDRLLERGDAAYLPGHGGAVRDPRPFVRALRSHRKMREAAVLHRLEAGDRTIAEIVAAIYRRTDPRLFGAAALSVLAHLEDLLARGHARALGPPTIDGRFEPA